MYKVFVYLHGFNLVCYYPQGNSSKRRMQAPGIIFCNSVSMPLTVL